MALIHHGSFDAFSATTRGARGAGRPVLGGIRTFAEAREATRAAQPVPIEFEVSKDPRGLALKTLKLTRGFEGFLQKIFDPTNEVYFLAWSWDLSGAPVVEYPGAVADGKTCIIPLRVGEVREFIDVGILLFPARRVTAGLATRIMLWESDQSERDFGKAMSDVASTIKTSELSNLISLVALGTGVTSATLSLIATAATELAGVVGKILQANSDDYVDFYEGYYPAAEVWTPGNEMHHGNASEISLNRFV